MHEASAKADQARLAAITATRESALAAALARKTEALRSRAETELAGDRRAIASASSPEAKERAENAKEKVTARIGELGRPLPLQQIPTTAEGQCPVTATREPPPCSRSRTRRGGRSGTQSHARARAGVSLYQPQEPAPLCPPGLQPILEIPVTVRDADRPIGTYVFTAHEERSGTHVRWSLVHLVSEKDSGSRERSRQREIGARSDHNSSGVGRSYCRKNIAPIRAYHFGRTFERREGNGTQFVVTLSNEPQGGLKQRKRPSSPQYEVRYDRPRNYWRSPYAGQFSTQWFRF